MVDLNNTNNNDKTRDIQIKISFGPEERKKSLVKNIKKVYPKKQSPIQQQKTDSATGKRENANKTAQRKKINKKTTAISRKKIRYQKSRSPVTSQKGRKTDKYKYSKFHNGNMYFGQQATNHKAAGGRSRQNTKIAVQSKTQSFKTKSKFRCKCKHHCDTVHKGVHQHVKNCRKRGHSQCFHGDDASLAEICLSNKRCHQNVGTSNSSQITCSDCKDDGFFIRYLKHCFKRMLSESYDISDNSKMMYNDRKLKTKCKNYKRKELCSQCQNFNFSCDIKSPIYNRHAKLSACSKETPKIHYNEIEKHSSCENGSNIVSYLYPKCNQLPERCRYFASNPYAYQTKAFRSSTWNNLPESIDEPNSFSEVITGTMGKETDDGQFKQQLRKVRRLYPPSSFDEIKTGKYVPPIHAERGRRSLKQHMMCKYWGRTCSESLIHQSGCHVSETQIQYARNVRHLTKYKPNSLHSFQETKHNLEADTTSPIHEISPKQHNTDLETLKDTNELCLKTNTLARERSPLILRISKNGDNEYECQKVTSRKLLRKSSMKKESTRSEPYIYKTKRHRNLYCHLDQCDRKFQDRTLFQTKFNSCLHGYPNQVFNINKRQNNDIHHTKNNDKHIESLEPFIEKKFYITYEQQKCFEDINLNMKYECFQPYNEESDVKIYHRHFPNYPCNNEKRFQNINQNMNNERPSRSRADRTEHNVTDRNTKKTNQHLVEHLDSNHNDVSCHNSRRQHLSYFNLLKRPNYHTQESDDEEEPSESGDKMSPRALGLINFDVVSTRPKKKNKKQDEDYDIVYIDAPDWWGTGLINPPPLIPDDNTMKQTEKDMPTKAPFSNTGKGAWSNPLSAKVAKSGQPKRKRRKRKKKNW